MKAKLIQTVIKLFNTVVSIIKPSLKVIRHQMSKGKPSSSVLFSLCLLFLCFVCLCLSVYFNFIFALITRVGFFSLNTEWTLISELKIHWGNKSQLEYQNSLHLNWSLCEITGIQVFTFLHSYSLVSIKVSVTQTSINMQRLEESIVIWCLNERTSKTSVSKKISLWSHIKMFT